MFNNSIVAQKEATESKKTKNKNTQKQITNHHLKEVDNNKRKRIEQKKNCMNKKKTERESERDELFTLKWTSV